MAKQRIVLVDDHEVVRLGLRALLDRHPQFEVVGEASSAREALEQVAALEPDVVVMDIRLPGTSGIEACEQIVDQHPNTKVIMLTSYAEDEMLFSAIRAGASGYVLKQIASEELVKAIEAVGRGEALLDPAVTQRVFQEVRRAVKEHILPAGFHGRLHDRMGQIDPAAAGLPHPPLQPRGVDAASARNLTRYVPVCTARGRVYRSGIFNSI